MLSETEEVGHFERAPALCTTNLLLIGKSSRGVDLLPEVCGIGQRRFIECERRFGVRDFGFGMLESGIFPDYYFSILCGG